MAGKTSEIIRIGGLRNVEEFRQHLVALGLAIPLDPEILTGPASPLLQPFVRHEIRLANRIVVHPMEGWDGTPDGNPSELTLRRWQNFGRSGAKLIWGGEAVAVCCDGRANPNQLVASPNTQQGLARLREALIAEHRQATGSDRGLLVGLQLTHSGRFSRPHAHDRPEPRILYHHPVLDRRLRLPADYPLLTDGEIAAIIEDFHRAARMAFELGFDFVDIKHCHGYLGHEFLSAQTRPGSYGGSFENRTRFLREVVEGIRACAPGLKIGVRLSMLDTIPYRRGTEPAEKNKQATGVPEESEGLIPYRWGFGVNALHPTEADLAEPMRFLALLEELGVTLANLSAGSPYSNPHLQRPAYYPPSDGYGPPRDPLFEVAWHLNVVRLARRRFPGLIIVGSGYSYLQHFAPHVAQAAVREDWADLVGLGRMMLAYPEMLWDAVHGRPLQHKRFCRTFSDCTNAPRAGLPSGCYPLDGLYKKSAFAARLSEAKRQRAGASTVPQGVQEPSGTLPKPENQ